MDKELLKRFGVIGIFILVGVLIYGLAKINSLTLTGEDLALIITLFIGSIIGVYYVISYYTGAKITDLAELKDLIKKLKGEEASDSNETTSSQ